jgi:hypothetical protein
MKVQVSNPRKFPKQFIRESGCPTLICSVVYHFLNTIRNSLWLAYDLETELLSKSRSILTHKFYFTATAPLEKAPG